MTGSRQPFARRSTLRRRQTPEVKGLDAAAIAAAVAEAVKPVTQEVTALKDAQAAGASRNRAQGGRAEGDRCGQGARRLDRRARARPVHGPQLRPGAARGRGRRRSSKAPTRRRSWSRHWPTRSRMRRTRARTTSGQPSTSSPIRRARIGPRAAGGNRPGVGPAAPRLVDTGGSSDARAAYIKAQTEAWKKPMNDASAVG